MVSSGMLRRVALVRTDVSKKFSASFIRVTRIGEIGTTLALSSIVPISPILVTLIKEALCSSETSVLTRTTSVISQKIQFFIVTAVKTSNLTKQIQFNLTNLSIIIIHYINSRDNLINEP
jgi:hypothetical protein